MFMCNGEGLLSLSGGKALNVA